ncbi:MAG: glycosyltransferase [Chloracidobacterium sp.]|nr:glycosyltransferase [Chloracidobacterium sp.]
MFTFSNSFDRMTYSRRPRVLHLINSLDAGGTERQAVELLNRIDEKRFEPRLAVLGWRGPLRWQIVERYPYVPEFPMNGWFNANAIKQLLRLRETMIEKRIAVLHTHDFYSGALGVTAARLGGIRVIAAQRHLRLSDRRVHDLGTRYIHKLANRVLVNAEGIRDHILKMGGVSVEKIVVIHNGLDAPANALALRKRRRAELLAELGLEAGARIVGSVAGFRPVKGHRYLLEAAAKVMQGDSRAHLVLVGDGELRDEIAAQIARLGIGARTSVLGHRDDSAQLAAAFDVAVLASLSEGLPNAVMEAMAAGAPVIATAVGGTPELIVDGETGFLVPPANSEALTERIEYVFSHTGPSSRIAMRGHRSIIERFGMERMVSSVERLYDEVISTSRFVGR